ncbi:MAG: type II toxin-antitoxin system YoeB family toxin [Desulfobacterales bacterium]|nr:type II toxin-antitoxin system YoeB family toxin [Desulfobacterales bacterium]
MTKPVKRLEFDPAGFEDLGWWIEKDRKKALKIIKLIKEMQCNPFEGTGKPEPLKHVIASCRSRRIDSASIPHTLADWRPENICRLLKFKKN